MIVLNGMVFVQKFLQMHAEIKLVYFLVISLFRCLLDPFELFFIFWWCGGFSSASKWYSYIIKVIIKLSLREVALKLCLKYMKDCRLSSYDNMIDIRKWIFLSNTAYFFFKIFVEIHQRLSVIFFLLSVSLWFISAFFI